MPFFIFRSHSRVFCAGLVFILYAGSIRADLLPSPLVKQQAAPAESTELTAAAVAAERVALQKEIATTRTELGKLPEGKLDETALWLTQETALLERIDNVYLDQQHTLQHAADLTKEAAEVDERTKARRIGVKARQLQTPRASALK